jgi:16S rRNA processing protein RimM
MDRLAVGRIGAAHGLRGALKVRSFSGETSHFFGLEHVFLGTGERLLQFAVEQVEPYRDGVLMKLTGVDTREKADGLRGREVWVEREHASALTEGEYYLADLCRCRVYREDREVGRVVAVCEGGNADLLEIEKPSGERLIVPFSAPFVGTVDVEEGRIFLDEGFEAL